MSSVPEPPAPRDASLRWMSLGLRDFRAMPLLSLAFGGPVTVAGWLMFGATGVAGATSLVLPLALVFLVTAPVLAVALMVATQLREENGPLDLEAVATLLWHRRGPLMDVALVLVMLALVWLLLSLVLFALFHHGAPPTLQVFMTRLSGPGAWLFMGLGGLVGLAVLAAAFAASVFSLPYAVDAEIPEPRAPLFTGVRLAWRCRWSLLGWAATLFLVTGASLVFFFLPLLVSFPVMAYASWHCYRSHRMALRLLD